MQTERFQILLRRDQVELLRSESRRTGRSMSELIRAAVEASYPPRDRHDVRESLHELFKLNLPVADWPEMEREIDQSRIQ